METTRKKPLREAWPDGAHYPFAETEAKWQARWLAEKTFRTPDEIDGRPKCYILVMFPYPSGSGLHVGHPESYTAADILARYKRMRGFRVLHPMGWDAFGLPAEQYAVETGVHPRITTKQNVDTFRRQVRMLGFSYDWDREVNTTEPGYYRWTQWIFLKLHGSWYDETAQRARPIEELVVPAEVTAQGDVAVRRYRDARRLAYQAEVPVNWCAQLGTVLANEEVVNGLSERGGHPVVRLPLRQWMLRITAYTERLLADLETVDWPEAIKQQQRNWIGKSTGAEVDFPRDDVDLKQKRVFKPDVPPDTIRVYTTRPDTIFGVTFMVLSPEHPLVARFTTPERRAVVEAYVAEAARKSELERTDLAKTKTGVDTGGSAINPANGERVPVWVADYVLMGYGTGAIMGVPGHDLRDYEFAQAMGIPVRPILGRGGVPLAPEDEQTPDVRFIASSGPQVSLDGLDVPAGKKRIVEWLDKHGHGRAASQTKLRDWLFSRQRYWGEPIPLLHGADGEVVPVPDAELPLLLPDLEDFQPSGRPEPLLAKASAWMEVVDPRTGKRYLRETNTMPQWAGSCWYYLRYIDPNNSRLLVDPVKERAWMPVDVYIGGAEHAVLHLLYSRFWHKVLFDLGYVSTQEPFQKLMNQGMILGEDGEKMSKSRGNVINPDDVVREHGADSLRLYEMFMGPLEVDKPWSAKGIQGVARYLDRAWRAAQLPDAAGDPHARVRHRTIRKVTEDVERVRHNTAIAALMEYVNELTKLEAATRDDKRALVLLTAPFAPHLAEELWERLGFQGPLAYAEWPSFDPELARPETVEIVVQVNGKVRARFETEPGISAAETERRALADEAVQRLLDGKAPRKVIVVPGRLVNLVV